MCPQIKKLSKIELFYYNTCLSTFKRSTSKINKTSRNSRILGIAHRYAWGWILNGNLLLRDSQVRSGNHQQKVLRCIKGNDSFRRAKGIYSRFRIEIKFCICHYFNPKTIYTDCIYRIMSPQSQKGKLPKKDLPLLKRRYHNNCKVSKTCHL